jgi:hypothetical protein
VGATPLERALTLLPKSRLKYNAAAYDPPLAAARFGYRYFDDWQELARDEQAFLIAAYRTEQGMRAYQAHEHAKPTKNRS